MTRILRSEEHTSELQSHSFISYAVFCLKKKNSIVPTRTNKRWVRSALSRHRQTRRSAHRVVVGVMGASSKSSCELGDVVCFFFNDTATTEIYTLSLHDALPI